MFDLKGATDNLRLTDFHRALCESPLFPDVTGSSEGAHDLPRVVAEIRSNMNKLKGKDQVEKWEIFEAAGFHSSSLPQSSDAEKYKAIVRANILAFQEIENLIKSF